MEGIDENKEKYITPCVCSRKSADIICVGLFACAAVFAFIAKLYPMIVVWGGLTMMFLASSIKSRKRLKAAVAFREEMLSQRCVKGTVKDKIAVPYIMGLEMPAENAKFYKRSTYAYKFVVEYEDPYTGQQKEVTSQPYYRNHIYKFDSSTLGTAKDHFVSDYEEIADVYVASDGRASVEITKKTSLD